MCCRDFQNVTHFCHNIDFRPLITEKRHMPLQTNVIYTSRQFESYIFLLLSK